MDFNKEEKNILIDACLLKINSLNSYKYYEFVQTNKIEKQQKKLQKLIERLTKWITF